MSLYFVIQINTDTFTLVFSYLLSQRLVKVVTTMLLELSFVLVRLALSLTIPCVLDKLEVLEGVAEQPSFPPWEFYTAPTPSTPDYWQTLTSSYTLQLCSFPRHCC